MRTFRSAEDADALRALLEALLSRIAERCADRASRLLFEDDNALAILLPEYVRA